MKKLTLLLITLFIFLNCNCQIKKCTISGRVIGRSSPAIWLSDALGRPDQPIVRIPVTDSTFTFELDADPVKAYMLNFEDDLSAKYPNHPYNQKSNDLITAYDKIKEGGEFIDFTLPDIDGNKITLSQVIKGKVALIDLWATWCGPCIRTCRSMIPVYNEFKDSGFTIIGVANEIDNTVQLRTTLEREKFPWLNLVEINNQNGIWAKYRIPDQAGGTFLVDKDGKILAISPSAENVRAILLRKLK